MSTFTPSGRVTQSKSWRLRLDDILQDMKKQQAVELDCRCKDGSGRHLSLSITHLEDAIMRQGMRCKEIDAAAPGSAPNPYPESYNPASPVVEPTADGLKL